MAGGNLFGLIFNIFAFSAIWVFLGALVDKIASVFGMVITTLPTLQDAVTGFNTIQIIWGSITVLAYVVFLINYFMNEHSQSSQEV
jgi:type II secretory pathway component PulF